MLEEPIDVADLFRYQRYRWLYVVCILCLVKSDVSRSGESEKLATRYRKFNLQGLLDASVKTVGIYGISCMLFPTSTLRP